jgi:histidine ammonia-lyase
VLSLDGRSLRIADVVAVADARRGATLSPDARARMRTTRDIVERAVHAGKPVYGVNTGFGKLSDVSIPLEQLECCSATSCEATLPA